MTVLSLCPTYRSGYSKQFTLQTPLLSNLFTSFFFKKNLKSWICANSVICFANNLYFVTTEHFCYKVCFFADLGKGIPFISGTFFFDVMFNSLLPMTTFCVVWTDCSCNISFPVDCSLLRGYFFLQMYRINVHCAKQRVCS